MTRQQKVALKLRMCFRCAREQQVISASTAIQCRGSCPLLAAARVGWPRRVLSHFRNEHLSERVVVVCTSVGPAGLPQNAMVLADKFVQVSVMPGTGASLYFDQARLCSATAARRPGDEMKACEQTTLDEVRKKVSQVRRRKVSRDVLDRANVIPALFAWVAAGHVVGGWRVDQLRNSRPCSRGACSFTAFCYGRGAADRRAQRRAPSEVDVGSESRADPQTQNIDPTNAICFADAFHFSTLCRRCTRHRHQRQNFYGSGEHHDSDHFRPPPPQQPWSKLTATTTVRQTLVGNNKQKRRQRRRHRNCGQLMVTMTTTTTRQRCFRRSMTTTQPPPPPPPPRRRNSKCCTDKQRRTTGEDGNNNDKNQLR